MSRHAELSVIGVGNFDRGDDGAGREVVRRLKGMLPPGAALHECEGEASELIALFETTESALIVDAVFSGGVPGSIIRVDCSRTPLPASIRSSSTHGLGIAHAIELARSLGKLPETMIVYGIEAKQFDLGRPISPEVLAGIGTLTTEIVKELSRRMR
jgi:hydrogenase maturation protease